MRRGQASLELFFTLTLFVLVLFWFNNFLQTASASSQESLAAQKDAAAATLAKVANAACILEERIQIRMPCILGKKGPEAYNLQFAGKTVRIDQAQQEAACNFENLAITVTECGKTACLSRNPVRLTEGPCP
ncbi:MAG TPA: hypothetical protein VI874_03630 [Candidatus Norongarragalinales archaeon]|nr:hypothetical protein [Candidatus Norongarragalinales archaeon]